MYLKPRIVIESICVLFCGVAAAGGHFDVDDAGVLDPGQCQYDIWGARANGEPKNLFHVGPACRVGPVEVGLNYDGFSDSSGRFNVWGPQLKWMFLGGSESIVNASISVSAARDSNRSGKTGREILLPVSFRVRDDLLIHANLGYDWELLTGYRLNRRGAQVEWAFDDKYSLIAERNKSFDAWTTRAGVRYNLTPSITIDASAARSSGAAKNLFIVGITHEFSH